jgi:hypothetical protein
MEHKILWRKYRYHGSDFGQSQFLEFGAVKSGTSLLTLRRNVLPTSSGLKGKPSKEVRKKKHYVACLA